MVRSRDKRGGSFHAHLPSNPRSISNTTQHTFTTMDTGEDMTMDAPREHPPHENVASYEPHENDAVDRPPKSTSNTRSHEVDSRPGFEPARSPRRAQRSNSVAQASDDDDKNRRTERKRKLANGEELDAPESAKQNLATPSAAPLQTQPAQIQSVPTTALVDAPATTIHEFLEYMGKLHVQTLDVTHPIVETVTKGIAGEKRKRTGEDDDDVQPATRTKLDTTAAPVATPATTAPATTTPSSKSPRKSQRGHMIPLFGSYYKDGHNWGMPRPSARTDALGGLRNPRKIANRLALSGPNRPPVRPFRNAAAPDLLEGLRIPIAKPTTSANLNIFGALTNPQAGSKTSASSDLFGSLKQPQKDSDKMEGVERIGNTDDFGGLQHLDREGRATKDNGQKGSEGSADVMAVDQHFTSRSDATAPSKENPIRNAMPTDFCKDKTNLFSSDIIGLNLDHDQCKSCGERDHD
ncbi:hypothetical protein BDZ45DRAFT_506134 [Acephala macrosclerotiorum]|nr:hypothetical protein BDZ45DRAFT_506134 [Acephala macrosclerotiorum]